MQPTHHWQQPLQPLLLWQTLACTWFCGLLALRWSWGAFICLALVFIADKRLWRPLPACLGILLFGAGVGVTHISLPALPTPFHWMHTQPPLEGSIESVHSLPDNRLRIILTQAYAIGNTQDAPHTPLPGKVVWTWENPSTRPLEGQKVRLTLPLRDITGFRNPSLGDFAFVWQTQGVFWRLWSRGNRGDSDITGDAIPSARVREHMRRIFMHALTLDKPSTQAQAFLPAFLFGEKGALTSQTMERMAQASLIHSLALSGQHLAVVGILAAIFIYTLGMIFPTLYLYLPRHKWIVCLSILPALGYLWLGNSPASLLRAFAMLGLLAFFLWKNRVTSLLDILITATVLITLFWPLALMDTALQLSLLCMAAIAISAPFLSRIPSPSRTTTFYHLWKILRVLVLLACVSFVLQWVLMPVSLSIFGFVSPWFILNVFWLPILGLWVLPLTLLGFLFSLAYLVPVAHFLLTLAAWPCDILLQCLDYMAAHGLLQLPALLRPHWTVLPAWAALCGALALLPHRTHIPLASKRLAFAAAVLLCVGPMLRLSAPLLEPLRIALLDVGQGQAVALFLPGGERVLIDGGGSTSPRFDPGQGIVSPVLRHNAPPRLHSVINSHPDSDHLRGLKYILQTFTVGVFYHNGETADIHTLLQSFQGTPLYAGMLLPLPSTASPPLYMEVLHPPKEHVFTGNNASLIIRLVQGDKGIALFTGDAEVLALRQLLATGYNLQADVLVLPHHGSRSSLLPDFYDAVQPKIALVSRGTQNRYNYPAPEVLRALAIRGIPVLDTGKQGYVETR